MMDAIRKYLISLCAAALLCALVRALVPGGRMKKLCSLLCGIFLMTAALSGISGWQLSDFAQENFSGIAVIKAFVKEYKELQAFRKLNKENEEINVTYTKIATLLEVLVTLFVESVVCIILGYGGYLVYQGRFNAGQLVEYIGYFEAIVWPIMAVSMLIEKTSRGRASLNRITELLDAPIDVADRPGVADLTDPKGGIEFRHLNFRYPDGEYDVLQDISFRVEPGESVGIVGKTGAGKTALVDLLLRTYNVPDGTLFVDGRDVNSLSIHSVRNACAYVPQDNFLFSDTIAHNIAFGVDDATPEDIERAASMADVRDNIVDFKDGYETGLGERGVTVSGVRSSASPSPAPCSRTHPS